jgi:hypothetical protein
VPYLIELPLDDDRAVSKSFQPPMSPRQKVFIDGMSPRPAEVSPELPTSIHVGRPASGELPHILGWSLGPWVVSPEVREIIEDLEPRVHRSVPLSVISERDEQQLGTYHLLLETPQVDALDVAHTEWHRNDPKQGLSHRGQIALRSRQIGSLHLWKLTLPIWQTYFVSEQFRERLLKGGLDGWMLRRKCVLRPESVPIAR